MKQIPFRKSLGAKLLLAILSLPILLTVTGFFLFQQTEHNRIVEFSNIKLLQLKRINKGLLMTNREAFREKSMRIASDTQILVPYKLNVQFQLQAYLSLLLEQNNLESIAILSSDGSPPATVGQPLDGFMVNFSKEVRNAQNRQNRTFFALHKQQDKAVSLCLVALSPILSGNKVIAVLLIAKNVSLGESFSNVLLLSHGFVQSRGIESSFLLPFVKEIEKIQNFDSISLTDKAVFVSKMEIPDLHDQKTYLVCGLDQRGEFANNKHIISSGALVSILILLILAFYSSLLSRHMTKPLIHIVNIADSISSNNMDIQWLPERNDEIGILNRSLKIMTEKLQKTIDQLILAQQKAETANRAKTDFLANMSHELRTPLNHIIGFTELTVDRHFGDLNETQHEYLNDVLQSSRHLLSLINDILDLSKVEAGKMALDLNDVHLRMLLNNSLIMFKEKTLKHNIQMVKHIDQIPETVIADERKLKQIIYNILSNAVKFTPDGGTVSLDVKKVTNGGREESDSERILTHNTQHTTGNVIEISVIDTGIGIKQEDLDRIFNPFEQADSSASRHYEGTGLGLSLTQKMIELHGGKIWVESEGEGKGSKFSFTIPI